jgi:hypothetical protein
VEFLLDLGAQETAEVFATELWAPTSALDVSALLGQTMEKLASQYVASGRPRVLIVEVPPGHIFKT